MMIKKRWENKCDEARGLIRMSISTDLRFHIFDIDEPDKTWEKLESMFGKHNKIRGRQFENDLISLNPSDFSCIKYYLSSIKPLDSYVKNARLRKNTNNVFIIFFPNLDLHILFFVSTFYSMK